MKKNYFWDYKNTIINTLRNSITKGNKVSTTIKKISDIIEANSENFYNSEWYININKDEELRYKRTKRAYHFLKSGFFTSDIYSTSIKLDEIKQFHHLKNGEYVLHTLDTRYKITKEDYVVLKDYIF